MKCQRAVRHVRIVIAIAVFMSAPVSAQTKEFRVHVVDLLGNPIQGIKIEISEVTAFSGQDGVALFDAKLHPNYKLHYIRDARDQDDYRSFSPDKSIPGLKIEANLESATTIASLPTYLAKQRYIGRVKRVWWNTEEQFFNGCVLPMWKFTDVNKYADAIVRNPTHLAVALRRDPDNPDTAIVVARSTGNANEWVKEVGQNLPQVTWPELARYLHDKIPVGEYVPRALSPHVRQLYREVGQQVCFCVAQQAPQPAPNQPPPPAPWVPSPPPQSFSPPYYQPFAPPIPAPHVYPPPVYPPRQPSATEQFAQGCLLGFLGALSRQRSEPPQPFQPSEPRQPSEPTPTAFPTPTTLYYRAPTGTVVWPIATPTIR